MKGTRLTTSLTCIIVAATATSGTATTSLHTTAFASDLRKSVSTSDFTTIGSSRKNIHMTPTDVCERRPLHRKPNASLSSVEKKEKTRLKKVLKFHMRRKKLEKQIQHSLDRKDPIMTEGYRRELEQFLLLQPQEKTLSCEQQQQHDDGESHQQAEEDEFLKASREAINSINKRLFEHAKTKTNQDLQTENVVQSDSSKGVKEGQKINALPLLQHMTKGTQSLQMFEDPNILWGYTRFKFNERAILVCKSLAKLAPKNTNHSGNDSHISQLKEEIWEQLGRVRSACSIGCGPGNDIVGLVAFLQSMSTTSRGSPPVEASENLLSSGQQRPRLERVILLDWAMEEWAAVLNPLDSLLVPHYLNRMDRAVCDVTDVLRSSEVACKNQRACQLLLDHHPPFDDSHVSSIRMGNIWECDMFLVSYLLSETHGKWHAFFKELVLGAKPGSLFYFAEPTPWQLHSLISQETELDFIWLDSSMYHPELQSLDMRVGPAVLFARKKQRKASN
eukprot:scaffold8387_cov46-Attheya_sp.AAC.1